MNSTLSIGEGHKVIPTREELSRMIVEGTGGNKMLPAVDKSLLLTSDNSLFTDS